MKRAAGLAGVAFAVFLSVCCGPLSDGECEEGESRCEDNAALTCAGPCSDPGCARRWEREACGTKVCIVPNGRAARCEDSAVEDPNCKNQPYCAGDRVVRCVGQYAVGTPTPCGSEGCVETDTGAECRMPLDPACVGGVPFVCDGLDSVSCEDGRIVSRTPCEACDFATGRCDSSRE